MADENLSPEEAAAERLEQYLTSDFSRDGGGGPIDPRCKVCGGNATDVQHQGRIEFRQVNTRGAAYLALKAWQSHIFPLEGYRLRKRSDEVMTLPNWITPDTPYFVYTKKEPPEHYHQNPIILRVFVRPCRLCGAKDPFGYIERHLSDDYTEQGSQHDLDAIAAARPQKVPLAKPEIPRAVEEQIRALQKLIKSQNPYGPRRPLTLENGQTAEQIPALAPARAFGEKSLPEGESVLCSNCKCEAHINHQYCARCGHKFSNKTDQ